MNMCGMVGYVKNSSRGLLEPIGSSSKGGERLSFWLSCQKPPPRIPFSLRANARFFRRRSVFLTPGYILSYSILKGFLDFFDRLSLKSHHIINIGNLSNKKISCLIKFITSHISFVFNHFFLSNRRYLFSQL